MLIFWSLVRNSVVLAVYLLFSVACFFTVHEHCLCGLEQDSFPERLKLLSFQSGKISRNAFAPMTKVIKWMAGKIKDEENYRSRVSGMDAAVALQRKKTIKFLCIVDFSLSKQGIFFITLTQKDLRFKPEALFVFCIFFIEQSPCPLPDGGFAVGAVIKDVTLRRPRPRSGSGRGRGTGPRP